jgi:hypothetical protein
VLELDGDVPVVNDLLHRSGLLEPWLSLVRSNARLHWHTCDEQRALIARMDEPEPKPKRDPGNILKVVELIPEPTSIGASG